MNELYAENRQKWGCPAKVDLPHSLDFTQTSCPPPPPLETYNSLSHFTKHGSSQRNLQEVSPVCPFFELNEGLPPLKPILLQSQFFPTGFICDPLTYGKGLKLAGHFTMCQTLLDTKIANARAKNRYSWDLEH